MTAPRTPRNALIALVLLAACTGCGLAAPGEGSTSASEEAAGQAIAIPTPTEAYSAPAPVELPGGLAGARVAWSYDGGAAYSGLVAQDSRIAVLMADGRLMLLNVNTGTPESGTFVWDGMQGGITEGEMATDGMIVAVAAYERLIPGREDRARFAVYDSGARELWALPELGQGSRYRFALADSLLTVGGWPEGSYDNALTAYDPATGEELWRFESGGAGYRDLATTEGLVLALIEQDKKSVVVAITASNGEEAWRWENDSADPVTQITTGDGRVYLVRREGIVALSLITGTVNWRVGFATDPAAALVESGGYLFTTPAPTEDLGYRPGVIALSAASGELAWHVYQGFVVDALALDGDVLWIVRKDYASGGTWLEALPFTGGPPLASLVISQQPNPAYALAVSERRILITGDAAHLVRYEE